MPLFKRQYVWELRIQTMKTRILVNALFQFQASPLSICVMLGKLLKLSEPPFPYLQNEDHGKSARS